MISGAGANPDNHTQVAIALNLITSLQLFIVTFNLAEYPFFQFRHLVGSAKSSLPWRFTK